MEKIVKSTVIHQDDNYQQSDQTLLKNLKKILDIIQSGLHYIG